MATDSLWRQGWDRENASGNGLMGKCCTVIIMVYFLSCVSWCVETEPVSFWSDEVCFLFVWHWIKLWRLRSLRWTLDTTSHHYKNNTLSSNEDLQSNWNGFVHVCRLFSRAINSQWVIITQFTYAHKKFKIETLVHHLWLCDSTSIISPVVLFSIR